jgi:hypothetical protein
MGSETSLDAVLEAIMAGKPASEIEPILQELSRHDRQTLLCTACSNQEEIASNCLHHGKEISALLTSNCPLYVNGKATCLLDLPVTVRFEVSNAALAAMSVKLSPFPPARY